MSKEHDQPAMPQQIEGSEALSAGASPRSNSNEGSRAAVLAEKSSPGSMTKARVGDRAQIAKLREQNALLRLQLRNKILEGRISALSTPPPPSNPWWRDASTIKILTAIVAAVIPITTFIQGCSQKNREIDLEVARHAQSVELEKTKQAHDITMERERQTDQIRTAYLERLKTPGEHLRTLRFIMGTTTDPTLYNWALEEKAETENRIEDLDRKLVIYEAESAAAQNAYFDALAGPDAAGSDVRRRKDLLEQAQKKMQHVSGQIIEERD